MTPHRRTKATILVLLWLLATGCGTHVVKTLSDLVVLRDEIVKKFGDEVNVNIDGNGTGSTLVVTFVNSHLNEKTIAERAKRAQETADLVKVRYPSIRTVGAIWVTFLRQTTEYVVVHHTQGMGSFGFDRDARPLLEDEDYPSDHRTVDLETRATYLDNRGESDVAVSGLQLAGEPGAGLTLIPHFTVTGDANQVKTNPPTVVGLDFASYGKEAKFQEEITVKFLVDRRILFETKGKFTSYKSSDSVNQFCYLKIPYKEFLRIIAGESLTIRLGENDDYELSGRELDEMRRMTLYVKGSVESTPLQNRKQ